MNREELLEEYERGRLDSMGRLMAVRSHLSRVTGLDVPRRPADARDWWRRNKSHVARLLREDPNDGDLVEDDGEAEDTEANDNESQ